MFYDFQNSGSIGKVKHNLTNQKQDKKIDKKRDVNVKKKCARPQPQPRPRLDPGPRPRLESPFYRHPKGRQIVKS